MLRRPWSTKHKYVATVCQSQLTKRLAVKYGLLYSPVKRLVDSFLESIVEELSRGNRVELYGLGVFLPKARRARRIQSPVIGGEVHVPDHRGVQFKLGRHLKRRLNETPLTPEEARGLTLRPTVPAQPRPKRLLRRHCVRPLNPVS